MLNRMFAEEELELAGARTSDLIDAAIDSGDLQKAKRLNHRMYKEFLGMHDLYLRWVTALLSHIYGRYGDDALHQALGESFAVPFRPVAETYHGSDARAKVERFAWGLRGHMQPLRIVEDDDKITLMMQPCGSGGRLVLNKEYEGPTAFAKIRKPQHMTFGREDFPIYCAHCSFQEMLPLEWFGEPVFVAEPAQRIGEQPCLFHIYKDPRRIPGKYYERYGRHRDERAQR